MVLEVKNVSQTIIYKPKKVSIFFNIKEKLTHLFFIGGGEEKRKYILYILLKLYLSSFHCNILQLFFLFFI